MTRVVTFILIIACLCTGYAFGIYKSHQEFKKPKADTIYLEMPLDRYYDEEPYVLRDSNFAIICLIQDGTEYWPNNKHTNVKTHVKRPVINK